MGRIVNGSFKHLRVIAYMLTMLLCWPPLVAQAQGQGLCDDDAYYADDMSGVIIDRHGKSILYLFGGFGENAANNVRNQIRRTRDYDEVWMCSSGGFVNQGMAIGRQLNAVKATVRVPRGFRCVSFAFCVR